MMAKSDGHQPRATDATTDSPEYELVWRREAAPRRAVLSRDSVVDAAVLLADQEGLAAVTVRRLATILDARPMSLYSYAQIASKEELLDLMADRVCAEMILPRLPDDWREALETVTGHGRSVLLHHPWWIELIGRNLTLGPNAIKYREQSFAAIASLDTGLDSKLAIVLSVETYMVGQVAFALDEQRAPERERLVVQQRREAQSQYARELIASGDFPNLAGLGPLPTAPQQREELFLRGLRWLIAGIAATTEG